MALAVLSAVALMMTVPATGAQQAPPPPPPVIVSDYWPGPWAFVFVEGSTRFTPPSDHTSRGIAEMAQVLPDMGIALCATDAIGKSESKKIRLRRLTAVAAFVKRAGIRNVIFGTDKACASEQPRRVPAIIAYPNPYSPT